MEQENNSLSPIKRKVGRPKKLTDDEAKEHKLESVRKYQKKLWDAYKLVKLIKQK